MRRLAVAATAGAGRASDVLLDTYVGNQAYLCGAFVIEGGTTNGYPKTAASFTVTQPAKVTSVVFPLMVEVGPARIQVTIVAAKPWDGIDPGTGSGGSQFWNNTPDESAVLGQAKSPMVSVIYHAGALPSPCGPPAQIVTATFQKPVSVLPGMVYWVLLQNPAGQTSTFTWFQGLTLTTASGYALYQVDANGSRWVSILTDYWRPAAMRVIGKIGK